MLSSFLESALAQTVASPVDLNNTNLPALSWERLFGNVIWWLSALAGLACFLGILYSGYMIITAGGDPAQMARAKTNMLWAIAGLLVALLAYVIVRFVFGVADTLILDP